MSPTARPFLEDAAKRLTYWLVGDGTQDIADVYANSCAADTLKIGIHHLSNKCPYCGQWGRYHTVCEHCGAPIG